MDRSFYYFGAGISFLFHLFEIIVNLCFDFLILGPGLIVKLAIFSYVTTIILLRLCSVIVLIDAIDGLA